MNKLIFLVIFSLLFAGGFSLTSSYEAAPLKSYFDVPIVPVTLHYSLGDFEKAVNQDETQILGLNHQDWEDWFKPVIKVSFYINESGDIILKECEAFTTESGNTGQTKLTMTDQQFSIEKNIIYADLTGYPDDGISQGSEQTYSFIVHFVPVLLTNKH